MGLLSAVLKAGIAKKIFDEARKPRNQAKARELFAQASAKGRRQGGTRPR